MISFLKKNIIFLLCLSQPFLNNPVTAQSKTTKDEPKKDETAATITVFVVLGLCVIWVIIPNSGPEFRQFKQEIRKIDILIGDKNTALSNRNSIKSSFSNGDTYYSKSYRASSDRLNERKQYFDNQKKTFSNYLRQYYEPQFIVQKNQYFENISKNDNNNAGNILDKNIASLIQEWKYIDQLFDYKYNIEVSTLENIQSTAKLIDIKKSELLDIPHSVNY